MDNTGIDFTNVDSMIGAVQKLLETLPTPYDEWQEGKASELTEREIRRYHMVLEEHFGLWHQKGMMDGSNDAEKGWGSLSKFVEKKFRENNYNFESFTFGYDCYVPKGLEKHLDSLMDKYNSKYKVFPFDPYFRGWIKGFLGYTRHHVGKSFEAIYVTGDGVLVHDYQTGPLHLWDCRQFWLEAEFSALEDLETQSEVADQE